MSAPLTKRNKKRHFAVRSIACESLEERAMLAVLSGDVGSAFETNETLADAADLGSITGSNPFSTGNSVQVEARIGDHNGTEATNLTDVDIYRVDLKAGDLVTFDVDAQRLDNGMELFDAETGGVASNADNVIRLFRIPDEGGFTELASNSAAIAPGDANDGNTVDPAIVNFSVPVTGTYYVGVSGDSEAGNDYDPVVAGNRNPTEHTGQYVLSITAEDDDNQTPSVDVTPPNDTDGGDSIVSWTISDESGVVSQTARILRDGVIIRPEAPVDLEGEFDLAEFGPGNYRITITATDGDNDFPGDQLTNIHSVLFAINDDDATPPEIVIIPAISSDGANNVVEWRSSDDSGIASSLVRIFQNDELVNENEVDASGTFDLNSLGIGEFTISVVATDADTDRDNDQLTAEAERTFTIVDDDTNVPTVLVESPANSDGVDNIARWNVSDTSGVSSVRVRISRGDEVIFEGDRPPVSEFDLNTAGLGNFEIAVSATDADNDWVGDQLSSDTSVTLFSISDDDVTAPVVTITPPSNNDGVANTVSWLATDQSGISLVTAVIEKDGDQIFSGQVSAEDDFDLDSFGVGNFVITVTAVDGDNDWDNDSLSITDSAEFSIIDDDRSGPDIDIQVSQASDGVSNFISWSITDVSGIAASSAVITRNGSPIFEGPIEASGQLEIDADGLGDYAITINAIDADNDWDGDDLASVQTASLSVIDDDTQAPEIIVTGPNPTDGDDNQISWRVSDDSGLAEVLVTIVAGGETLQSGTAEASGSIDLNALGLVDVSIEVTATDADSDWDGDSLSDTVSETFSIVDDDDRSPSLQINHRDQVDGENNSVSWTASDVSGLSEVRAEVVLDNVRVFDDVVGAVDQIDLNAFGPGEFAVTVRATDADDDWQDAEAGDTRTSIESETFVITDDDTDVPVITINTPDESDGIDNTVTWTVTDASGVSNVTLEVVFNGDTIDTRTVAADGSFDTNSLGIGVYQINLTAIDNDNDWEGDRLQANANATFTVIDDDTVGPDIDLQLGGRTDGDNNTVSWSANDTSGVASISATLEQDGVEIDSQTGPGSFDLNSLGLGSFQVSVTAVDADADWDGDQSAATIEQSFSISDDDTLAPLIAISPPNGTTESADIPNQFVWTASDAGGISSASVRIERQDAAGQFVVVSQRELNTAGRPTAIDGEESIDDLGFGVFRITINTTDADNDRENDSLSSQLQSTLEIADRTPPTVVGANQTDVAVPLTPGVVDFIFSEDVSESLDPSDVILRNLSTNEDLSVEQDFVWNPADLTATLDLTGIDGLDFGLYTVILRSAGINDAAGNELDGNNNGVSGGNYENELIRFPVTWRGDADRDVHVEFEDFLTLSTNFGQQTGQLWTDGDFTGDGAVLFEDFLWLSTNFGLNRKPG